MEPFPFFQAYLGIHAMNNRLNRLKTKREQRQKRNLRLGGYLIVTDTEETEANYFNGFVSNIPSKYKDDLQIKIFPGKDLKTIIRNSLAVILSTTYLIGILTGQLILKSL